jgi:hypothetical protein
MKLSELIEKLNELKEFYDIMDEDPKVEIKHNTPYNVDRNLKNVDDSKMGKIIVLS